MQKEKCMKSYVSIKALSNDDIDTITDTLKIYYPFT